MGSSGGGMSAEQSYQMQKAARIQAEQEVAKAEAKKIADAQSRADSAEVTTEGGVGSKGVLSVNRKLKKSTYIGSGEAGSSKIGE